MNDSTKTHKDPDLAELEDKDIGGGPDADALEGAFALPEEDPVEVVDDLDDEDEDEDKGANLIDDAWNAI